MRLVARSLYEQDCISKKNCVGVDERLREFGNKIFTAEVDVLPREMEMDCLTYQLVARDSQR